MECSPAPEFIDGHSGAGEHSMMMAFYPKVVKLDVIPTLKEAGVTPARLAEWRKGGDFARAITPLGFTGNPSRADAARGRAASEKNAQDLADAIAGKLK